jgi:hypothetical protein
MKIKTKLMQAFFGLFVYEIFSKPRHGQGNVNIARNKSKPVLRASGTDLQSTISDMVHHSG